MNHNYICILIIVSVKKWIRIWVGQNLVFHTKIVEETVSVLLGGNERERSVWIQQENKENKSVLNKNGKERK